MKKFASKILFGFIAFIALFPIAFSDWIVSDSDNTLYVGKSSNTPVCYINNDTEANRYYALETALKNSKSGDTIYVIPKTYPVINHDCEIKSGVTLTIGGLTKGGSYIKENGNYTYSDRGVENESSASSLENSAENRGPHTNTFADLSEANVQKYRQNSVVLNANLKINTSGRLNIAGRLGQEDIGISGATTGDYCEIVMTGKGKIDNYGTIDCLGYIKQKDENSKMAEIFCRGGSFVYAPFIIQDFNGGTYTVSCNPKNGQKVMPFNEWTCCNIQVKQTFYYNSSLKGYYDVYNAHEKNLVVTTIRKGHKTGSVDLIMASNSVITFDNSKKDARVVIDVLTDDCQYTSISKDGVINKKNKISFYGTCGINQMKIPNPMPGLQSFSGLTNVDIGDVYTSSYLFSVNHYFDVDIFGTLNVGTNQKVLPGCNVTVKKSGVLNINSNVIFVENLDEKASGATKAYKYPTIYNQSKSENEILNALVVEGTLVVDGSSSALGGKVYSSTLDSSIDLLGTNSLNVSYKEAATGVNDPNNKLHFNVTYEEPALSENARGPVINDSGVSVSDFNKSFYVYMQEGDNIGWKEATDLDSYHVVFHLNGGTADYVDGYQKDYFIKKGISKTITSLSINQPSKEYFDFEDWYLDESLSKSLSSGVVVKNGTTLNLYAKYGATKYKVSYVLENNTGIEAELTNPNTLVEFTHNQLIENGGSYHLEDAVSNEPDRLVFEGWYTDSSYSVDSKLSHNDITECKDYVLYGRFVKVRPKITIEGISIDGTNVFMVDENGRLPSSVVQEINKEITESKKDINNSRYFTGLSMTVGGESINFNSYEFTQDQTLYLLTKDKCVVNYVLDSNLTLKKYFVRDEYGKIFGDVKPIFDLDSELNLNSTYTKNDERHLYRWKTGNTVLENQNSSAQDISTYVNSTNESSYTFNAWWAYRLIVDVKSSGTNNAKITCSFLGWNNKEVKAGEKFTEYVPSSEEIKIIIPNYALRLQTATKVSSTNNIFQGNNTRKDWAKGEWSKADKMPEFALTIMIEKG